VITSKIVNIDAIAIAREKIDARRDDAAIKAAKIVVVLRSLILSNLQSVLGEKAKYFDVAITTGNSGLKISVRSNNIIADFIYEGTSSHLITSTNPMRMPDGRYARSVEHPGTKSMKYQIDQAVRSAVAQTRVVI